MTITSRKAICERCGHTSRKLAVKWLIWGGGRVGFCRSCWESLNLDDVSFCEPVEEPC